ncbi:MAG: Asp-tRNA(Asn)/Glu-tRNA(Gln) amidotransferase subunit GatA [Clostridiales bacterium]
MITDMTLRDLESALDHKEFSALEATQEYLERIDKLEPTIGAYITITAEIAKKQAAAADQRRARGEKLSPIDGIPMAVKDIICTEGVNTTCASKMLANYCPPYDATCWNKLKQNGAVLLGKCNMDEFAMGSSTESSAFKLTHNPFDINRVPGGSSGGSTAAVAANMAAYTLGTDTGGSVRQPAHFCGVVGLKPTYGRISRFGVIPYASSLDQVGILAKNCYDAATILEMIAGQDALDSTSFPAAIENYRNACNRSVQGMKIGIPREFLSDAIAPEIHQELSAAANHLVNLGAIVEEISLPHTKYALPAYYVLACAEASSNLARYDGTRYGLRVEQDTVQDMFTASRSQGFGQEVKRRIMLGTYALSSGYYDAYYNKTLQVRTLIKEGYDQIFTAGFDCLLTPPAPTQAFPIGANSDSPLTMYMQDICTVPVNLAGLPALVVPVNLVHGLPIGLQLIASPFSESKLFTVGTAIESSRLLPQFGD